MKSYQAFQFCGIAFLHFVYGRISVFLQIAGESRVIGCHHCHHAFTFYNVTIAGQFYRMKEDGIISIHFLA